MIHQTYDLGKQILLQTMLFLGCLLFVGQALHAQTDYFLNFENGDPFMPNGNVRSEFTAVDNAQCLDARRLGDNLDAVCNQFPNVPAQDNGNCMSYNTHNVGPNPDTERNILWIVDNFDPGDYRVSFDLVKRFPNNRDIEIELRTGQFLSSILVQQTIIVGDAADWNTYSACIHLTEDDQIFELVLSNLNIFDDFAIDNFVLEKVQQPEFEFVDATGSPVDKYCYGEDVYITLAENLPVSSFFFAVRNGCDAVNDYTIGEWNPYVGGTPINLSQILRDRGKPAIKPDLINCLKVAINDPLCGWQDLSKEFEYSCDACETDYAAFAAVQLSSNGTILGNALRDFTPYDAVHEFCVLRPFQHYCLITFSVNRWPLYSMIRKYIPLG